MRMAKQARGVLVVLLLVGGLLMSSPALAQAPRTYTILLRVAPRPVDPNEWAIVVPTGTNLQALVAAGFHPAGSGAFSTYEQAAAEADKLVMNRFDSECQKDHSIFWNPTTGDRVIVPDFAQPKPFGYHLEQGGICKAKALALIDQPLTYRRLSKPDNPVVFTKVGWLASTAVAPPVTDPPVRVRPPQPSTPPLVEPPPAGGNPPAPLTPPVPPPSAPPQSGSSGGGSTSGATPAPPQGERVGEEIRYGPFSANALGWQSTGVRLRKGQTFRIDASGRITGGEGENIGPHDGIGHWGWRMLCGRIGERGIEVRGSHEAWNDGVLELGVPRGCGGFSADDGGAYWSGAFTVYVYVPAR